MDLPTKDEWADVSFMVDSKNVMNYTGFIRLEVEDDKIILEPFGLELTVQSLTEKGAVLESKGHLYFADCSVCDDVVDLTVMRKDSSEVVGIRAEFSEKLVDSSACTLSM